MNVEDERTRIVACITVLLESLSSFVPTDYLHPGNSFSRGKQSGDTSSTSSALSTGMDRRCVSVGDEATAAAGFVHADGADGHALFGFEDAL